MLKAHNTLKGKLAAFPAIDDTLTKEGMCADAKATGDALGKRVKIADIVDALTSESGDKPLSARQGKELKALIDSGGLGADTTLTHWGFAADAGATGQRMEAAGVRLDSAETEIEALNAATDALGKQCQMFGALNFQTNTTQQFSVPDNRAAFLFGITFNGGHTALYFVGVNWNDIVTQQAIYKSNAAYGLTFSMEEEVLTVTCNVNYSLGFFIRGR